MVLSGPRCLVAVFSLLATGGSAPGENMLVLHVDDDAPPAGDGLCWHTAYRFLQDALSAARKPGSGVTEIRVAAGVYKPDRSEEHPDGTGDRAAWFDLVSGVAHRGGYAGIGWPDPDARDISAFETVLSGDLAGDDGPPGEFANYDENSWHVVAGAELKPLTLLEGFTITAGNGDGDFQGGGLFVQGGTYRGS